MLYCHVYYSNEVVLYCIVLDWIAHRSLYITVENIITIQMAD